MVYFFSSNIVKDHNGTQFSVEGEISNLIQFIGPIPPNPKPKMPKSPLKLFVFPEAYKPSRDPSSYCSWCSCTWRVVVRVGFGEPSESVADQARSMSLSMSLDPNYTQNAHNPGP